MNKDDVHPGSFRDPYGFLFTRNGILYRQVNQEAKEDYDHLLNSKLYQVLTDKGLLISHQEKDISYSRSEVGYKIIEPCLVPFISYPYEWSFSQYKDAALATLTIQRIAFEYGMTLKDASSYNIQFVEGKPVLIDTLSLTRYKEGEPWIAYRQFCQHFLAPLTLMSYADIRLSQLMRIYIDGIPLDLTTTLLPWYSRFNLSINMHLYLHSKSQKKYERSTTTKKPSKISQLGFRGIIDNLESTIKKLKWKPLGTQWNNYYNETNYSEIAEKNKELILTEMMKKIVPSSVWDLGANTGRYSRITSDKTILTIAYDIDPAAVEKNYLESKQKKEKCILPLLLDLTNPSPGMGWDNLERFSFIERSPVDLILALALIHHLAISNNLPLMKLAKFFQKLCHWMIIEFVPKEDSQVQRLLASRQDIFPDYTRKNFETIFNKYFSICDSRQIQDTSRWLYLFENRNYR